MWKIRLTTTKSFGIDIYGGRESHFCGDVENFIGDIIGHYSGNNFDGYRCVVTVDGKRHFVVAPYLISLLHKICKLINN